MMNSTTARTISDSVIEAKSAKTFQTATNFMDTVATEAITEAASKGHTGVVIEVPRDVDAKVAMSIAAAAGYGWSEADTRGHLYRLDW